MKTKVSSTLVLGLIGSMLAGCGSGAQDSTGSTAPASAKLMARNKSAACVAWVSGGTYTAGEVVTYNGANYTALVTQTDYAGTGWNPTVGSLFSPGGSCSGAPTPTPTPAPAPTPTPAPAPTPTPAGPAGYTFCANENGTCSLSGTNTVAFGANGDFNYQTVNGSINCTDAVFGDPDVGVVKACYYTPAPTPTPAGPAGYTFCANENGTCNLSGTNTVAFGANGDFTYQTITGNVSCTDAVFGDPDVGVVKACFYTPAAATGITSGASYKFVNPESGLVLDESGCGTSNGTNVDIWANGVGVCNGGAGQIWVPTLNSDGSYTITNPGSNMVLDLAGCGGAGANVDMWANGVGVCNGGAGQKWAFTLNSDGTYNITNPSSGLALDVASCGTTNGTNVDVWTNDVNVCNGDGGQKWQAVPATSTPTPTPTGSLPEHILVGYWQDFDNGAAVQTLAQVPTTYNLIAVAFANADSAIDGGVTFSIDSGLAAAVPGGYTAAQFTSDIKTLHSQGRFVVLSVGGQNGSFELTSNTMASNFANSLYALIQQYGFDGVDIDMENVVTSANYTYVETALRQLSSLAGSKLIITMAPQTIDMLPSYPTLDNYLQIARDLGSTITMVNTQYYNSGSMPGRNGVSYSEGGVDFITSQADAVLEYLNPSQVGLGLPASSAAAGSGYVAPSVVNAALDCLTQGTNCGTYIPVAKYTTLRGAMTWSTNWDASNGNNFSNTVAPHLGTLPK